MSTKERGGYSAGDRTVSELPSPPPSVTTSGAERVTVNKAALYAFIALRQRHADQKRQPVLLQQG